MQRLPTATPPEASDGGAESAAAAARLFVSTAPRRNTLNLLRPAATSLIPAVNRGAQALLESVDVVIILAAALLQSPLPPPNVLKATALLPLPANRGAAVNTQDATLESANARNDGSGASK